MQYGVWIIAEQDWRRIVLLQNEIEFSTVIGQTTYFFVTTHYFVTIM